MIRSAVTRRCIRVLALGLLLGGVALGLLGPGSAHALEEVRPCTFSETVDTGVYPWITPLLGRLDAEFEAAGRDVTARDASLTLSTWAAYGAGFLRHVKRARGLDALAVFDLGVVAAGDDPASTALGRIETILQTFADRRSGAHTDPALTPWRVSGLASSRVLAARESALALLAQAFAPGADRRPSVLLPHEAGGATATWMNAGEVPLPVRTSIHYLSHAVQYRRGMPAALRRIAVDLYFTIGIRALNGSTRRWTMTPSDPATGHPIALQDQLYFAVFPHGRALNRFAAHLAPETDILCARSYVVGRLLRTAPAELAAGDTHEALVQMQQVLGLMMPVYAPMTRQRVCCDLARWLDTPATRELGDLAAVAHTVQEARTVPEVFSAYVAAGTIEEIGTRYARACRAMVRQLPGQGAALERLAAELTRISRAREEAGPEAWAALSESAATLARRTGPDARGLLADLHCLESPFLAAGWRFLPVVGAEEGTVLLSSALLAAEQISPAALASLRLGRFTFRATATPGPAHSYLAMPVMHGHQEGRCCACFRSRLAEWNGCLQWRVGCARAAAR